MFVNYAHRGASAYAPENTMLSFYTGVYMGANGIETDVQRTKDGVLVLFHDNTIKRMTGAEGSVQDHTLSELQRYSLRCGPLTDRIAVFEDFLQHFAFQDLTFAIEIKQAGIEKPIADMIRKYGISDKCVVTSFMFDCIRVFKEYASEIKIGYLTKGVTDTVIADLRSIGGEEICPHAEEVTPESVEKWHGAGLNVRAWGVSDENLMRQVYDAHADGMTVNFPDKLAAYMALRG